MGSSSLFVSRGENVLMPFGILNLEVGEQVDLRIFALNIPSGAMEWSSEFKHVSEVNGEHSEAVVFEAVSHGLFLGFDNDLVFADNKNVHVQPFAALRELWACWVVWLGSLDEFPAVV
jgi:hypothetical protein